MSHQSVAGSAPALRAFVAIDLPSNLVEEVLHLQRRFQAALESKCVRWSRADQLHLTLRFFGSIRPAELPALTAALDCACRNISPLELRLKELGCFPPRGLPSVVWVGLGGELDSLRELQKQIQSETKHFGQPPEERAFQPHVTIGRVKARSTEARPLRDVLPSIPRPPEDTWLAREVGLIESRLGPQGSAYSRLASVALRGP